MVVINATVFHDDICLCVSFFSRLPAKSISNWRAISRHAKTKNLSAVNS
jgi:hypothetical protein